MKRNIEEIGANVCFVYCSLLVFLQNADTTQKILGMGAAIESALIENKFYILPVVYIKPQINETLSAQLSEIIVRRKCLLIDEEKSATHILYPPCNTAKDNYQKGTAE